MTDLLFSLTIGPLQLIYEVLYNGLVSITHNYGWALILLSFVTTLITVPLGKAVSNHIRKERLIESILDPQIKKIKATSTGAEQSKRIRNLYKRYSYNPLYSIRLAFGVLIQLPFLIGAYWMIAEHPSLSGISFGPIADISQPDNLLGGINVLPLIMTAANLGVVAISAQMPKRDRIQAIVIAILFLVLLYSAPAALLIYWTVNNILLLVRALIQKRNFGIKLPSVNYHITSGWKWGIFAYVVAVLATITTVPYFGFSAHRIGIIKACTDTIFLTLILATLTASVSFRSKTNTFKSVLCIAVAAYLSIRTFSFWILALDRSKLTTQFIVLIPILVLILRFADFSKLLLQLKKIFRVIRLESLLCPSFIFLLLLICFYLPVTIYSSDPLSFDISTSEIIKQLCINLEAGLVLSIIIWLAIKNFEIGIKLIAWLSSIFAAVAFTYTFIISPDYGVLSSFVLSKPEGLYLQANKYFDISIITVLLVGISALIILNKVKLLSWTFWCSSLVLICSSAYSLFNTEVINKSIQKHPNQTVIPQNIQDFFTFSENKKNIIVIMLDMFTGGNIREILQIHPDLSKKFDGFTWYEDSMSAGSFTIYGKPGILGGEETTPVNLNKDKSQSLEEKINTGWAKFLNVLQKENYRVSIYDHTWLKTEILQPKLIKPANLINTYWMWDGFSSRWAKANHLTVNSSLSPVKTLYAISLFRASPLSIKKKIYANGQWAKTVDTNQNNLNWALNNLSLLDGLSTTSSSRITKENTFKFFINELTHVPWSLNAQCKPSTIGKGSGNEKERNKNGTFSAHLHVEYCALESVITFLNWLKDNGIYDNTMVILVSDHGRKDSAQVFETWGKPYPIDLHSLLMVKPFEQRGELVIDTQSLTANWDVPVMILNEIDLTNTYPWKDKKRTRDHVSGEWQRSRHPKNNYDIKVHYKIQGSMFDVSNWKRLSK